MEYQLKEYLDSLVYQDALIYSNVLIARSVEHPWHYCKLEYNCHEVVPYSLFWCLKHFITPQ
jgi:hypothetical protein